ncbi:MAG: hypothetical protein CMO80_11740 [Verrucomicrobiales bacterium]|nr:hypothetical protein [Verrucomicrobiales bacterium]
MIASLALPVLHRQVLIWRLHQEIQTVQVWRAMDSFSEDDWAKVRRAATNAINSDPDHVERAIAKAQTGSFGSHRVFILL